MMWLVENVTHPTFWARVMLSSGLLLQVSWFVAVALVWRPGEMGLFSGFVHTLALMMLLYALAAVLGECSLAHGNFRRFEVTVAGGLDTFEGPDGLGPCHGAARGAFAKRATTSGVRALVPPLIVRVEEGNYNEWDPGSSEAGHRYASPLPAGETLILDLGSPEDVALLSPGKHLPGAGAGRWRSLFRWPFAAPGPADVWSCFRVGDRLVLPGVFALDNDVPRSVDFASAGFRTPPSRRLTREPRWAAGVPTIGFGGARVRENERIACHGLALRITLLNGMVLLSSASLDAPRFYEELTHLPWWTGLLPWSLLFTAVLHRRARWARYQTAWPWHGPETRPSQAPAPEPPPHGRAEVSDSGDPS